MNIFIIEVPRFINNIKGNNMNHYVYRITNIKISKHYYGTRTSKNRLPEEDIGYYYFSSSHDKEFIKDQKEKPQNYKYKIVKVFRTRSEAMKLEIKLHNKFNVGVNEAFYNRSKQTSTNWDTTGTKVDNNHEKNGNAKRIGIFNEKDEILFECFGNFKKTCDENNLPLKSLRRSYRENKKLYMDNRSYGNAKKKGNHIYKGWYASGI